MMERTLTFRIPGKPIAKARPKFVRKGSYMGAYNPQETEESRFLWEVKQRVPAEWSPLEGVITLWCEFKFKRPKSHFGTGKNADKLKPSAPKYHLQKPDLDNLVKFVKDCLNKVVWMDDKQIVEAKALKRWCSEYEKEESFIVVYYRE